MLILSRLYDIYNKSGSDLIELLKQVQQDGILQIRNFPTFSLQAFLIAFNYGIDTYSKFIKCFINS